MNQNVHFPRLKLSNNFLHSNTTIMNHDSSFFSLQELINKHEHNGLLTEKKTYDFIEWSSSFSSVKQLL